MDEQLDVLQELEYINSMLGQIEQERKDNAIVYFKDLGNQKRFTSSKAPVRLLFGSNRSGKSFRSTAEEVSCSLGYRPWLPEDHPDRIVRLANGNPMPVPNTGFHLLENLRVSGTQVFVPTLKRLLPPGVAKIKYNNLKQPVRVEFENKSVIHILSQEQSTESMEGISGHWLACDEPPARDKWVALTRGLIDNSGIAWIAATPIKASHFMAELMSKAGTDPDYELISLSIEDNRKSRGGYLDDAAVDRFIATLRPEEIQARLYGRPQHLAGAVYAMWKPERPFYVPPFEIPDFWPRVMAVDPAGRKPMAAVWMALSPDNKWYVYRELYDPGLRTIREVSDWIKKAEGWTRLDSGKYYRGVNAEPVVLRIIDTSANITERTSGINITASFADNGLIFMNALKSGYLAGIDMVKQLLTVTNEYEWDASPGLIVFNNCPRVAHEFMNFIWKPETSQTKARGADPDDKPLKANDDLLDGIRYIIMLKTNFGALSSMMDQLGDEDGY